MIAWLKGKEDKFSKNKEYARVFTQEGETETVITRYRNSGKNAYWVWISENKDVTQYLDLYDSEEEDYNQVDSIYLSSLHKEIGA